MSSERPHIVVSRHELVHGSFKSYIIGFLSSLYLTVVAYILAVRHALSVNGLIVAVIGLALVQFVIQLIFFLHVGVEAKPRWKLAAFWFMILIVAILVFGSLWIMSNLDYHMSQAQINSYLHSQDGL